MPINRLPADPTEHLEIPSSRLEQDQWRDDDYLGYIRTERVTKTGFSFNLTKEDLPYLKPSDKLKLLVISALAKLKTADHFFLQDSIYRPIYAEFGQEVDLLKGGITPSAYKTYADSNPDLIATAKLHVLRKKITESQNAKTRLIYKRGPWGMGSGLLIQKLEEILPEGSTDSVNIEPFFLREGDKGYDPKEPQYPNGRGFIFAPAPIADLIVQAAAEEKIVVNGYLKKEPRPFILTVEYSPVKK